MTQRLQAQIADYLRTKSPGYALMVTGPWGSGKTTQVKSILGSNCSYVRLYGLASASEIHAEVLAAAVPAGELMGKAAKAAQGIMSVHGAAAVAGAAVSGFATAVMRRNLKPELPIVFDDLERSAIGLGKSGTDSDVIMGVINHYVEELGFQVIIIAHDGKLADEIKKRFEKTVGRKVRVLPQVDEAFDSFVGMMSSAKAAAWSQKHKLEILDCFEASKSENLRLLRYALMDLESLFLAMDERHAENADVSNLLIRHLTTFGFEERSEENSVGLIESVCASRVAWFSSPRKKEGDPASVLDLFLDKYPSMKNIMNVLTTETWLDILRHGYFDPAAIQQQLDASAWFSPRSARQPWEVLWERFSYDDAEIEAAVADAWKQLDEVEIMSSSSLLHTFALLIKFAERGLIRQTVVEVRDRCATYLEKAADMSRIEIGNFNHPTGLDHVEEASGKGFAIDERSTGEARTAFADLKKLRLDLSRRAMLDFAKAQVAPLLTEMRTDSRAFFRSLSLHTEGSRFNFVPILSMIDHGDFLAAFNACAPGDRDTVLTAISARFHVGHPSKELEPDLTWARELYARLEASGAAASGYSAERFERYCHLLSRFRSKSEPEDADTAEGAVITDGASEPLGGSLKKEGRPCSFLG